MALSKTIYANIGLEVPNAYIKINTLSGNKSMIEINVKTYVSREASKNDMVPIVDTYMSFTPSVDDSAPNFIKQGYEYLKTLPTYAGAIDVLED